MDSASSARRTCSASRSASEYTAAAARPSSRHARMMRTAISPRLAMRTLRNLTLAPLYAYLWSNLCLPFSPLWFGAPAGGTPRFDRPSIGLHPENARPHPPHGGVEDGGQAERQNGPGLGRVDDAVVPQPRRAVVGAALLLVLRQNRSGQRLLLLAGHRLAFAAQLIVFDGQKNGRGLLAPHDGDSGIGPHPEEAGLVRAAAHRVVPRAVGPAEDHRDPRHARGRHRVHHLGAGPGDAGGLVLAADDEPGDVL